MIDVFYIGQGDRLPYYRMVQRDEVGVVDLSDVTAVYFYMKNMSTGSVLLSGVSAVIVDSPGGTVEYQWGVADTATIGEYAASFEFITASGKPYSLPRNTIAKVVVEDRYATG